MPALFGTTVRSPLFGVEIPVVAHPAAEPDKGAGIAMCCTFGDLTDVLWWRELQLPTRSVITRSGRIQAETPEWLAGEPGEQLFAEQVAGKTTFSAREAIVAALRESGDLDGEPKATQRKANFYERGEKPLEIVTSRQWYIRNGGRDADLNAEIDRARPRRSPSTRRSCEPATRTGSAASTVTGWSPGSASSASPIPVWYPLDDHGDPVWDKQLVPREDQLPVDPAAQAPEGYDESQRGQAGGFVGDPDIMDTWATSSLTPQIAGRWRDDPELFAGGLPDGRPPAGARHHPHLAVLDASCARTSSSAPCRGATPRCRGWILDPDRKKMSKSKGNVVTPEDVVKEHSADAVRYWAASGRLGADAAYDTGQMKVGRRLAIKILNATKFALSFGEVEQGSSTGRGRRRARCRRHQPARPRHARPAAARSWPRRRRASRPGTTPARSRSARPSSGPSATTTSSWSRTVPTAVRARPRPPRPGPPCASPSTCMLRLFAPMLPYVTEEVWSWWHEGSVHRAAWPTTADAAAGDGGDAGPAGRRRRGAGRRAQGQVGGQGRHARRGGLDRAGRSGRVGRPGAARRGATCARPAGSPATLGYAEAETPEVRDAELIPVEKPKA